MYYRLDIPPDYQPCLDRKTIFIFGTMDRVGSEWQDAEKYRPIRYFVETRVAIKRTMSSEQCSARYNKLRGWRAEIEAVEQRNGRNRKWRLSVHNDAFNLVSEEGKLLNRNNLRGKGQYTF